MNKIEVIRIYFILQCIYLMLPAYAANLTPVLVKKINFLNIPVDFNRKLGGKPIFGSHKTWRGLFFGIIAGIVLAFVQRLLYSYSFFAELSFIDYSSWLALGFLLGFGALFGDLIKSFIKRRLGVKPGARFIPWDQIDYSIGALLFVSIVFVPSWQVILAVLAINFILHIAANHLGYWLGLREVKW